MFELFTTPFMQRALMAGLFSGTLLGWIGVYATSRQMSFVGDGIAHASLAAIALAILVGWSPLPVALVFGVFAAGVLFFLNKRTDISQDTAVGILFTASMAVGVILLQFHQGYVPELVSFLFGNILAVTSGDLIVIAVFSIIGWFILAVSQRELLFVTVDPEGAYLANVRRDWYEFLLYLLTSLAVIISVKLIGIILVSGLLILPSAISRRFAKSFSHFQLLAIIFSIIIVIGGLTLSYYFNMPSGATIILFATSLFVLSRLVPAAVLKL